jgi:hypothetical protein
MQHSFSTGDTMPKSTKFRSENQVLTFVMAYRMTHGEYPSQRTISKELPMALVTVNKKLAVLASNGKIKLGAGKRIIHAGAFPKETND